MAKAVEYDGSLRTGIASPTSKTSATFDLPEDGDNLTSPTAGDVTSPRKRVKSTRAPQSAQPMDRTFRNLRMKQYQLHTKELNNQMARKLKTERKRCAEFFNDPGKFVSKRATMEDYLSFDRFNIERLIRKPGDVFTFGSGDCGELALGSLENDEDLLAKVPRLVTSLQKHITGGGIISMCCGGQHNAVVTYQGDVLTWGCNDDKALGREVQPELEFLPQKVDALKFDRRKDGIVQVDAGDTHTLALSLKGNVYMWGSYKNADGKQYRDPKGDEKVKGCHVYPNIVSKIERVCQIACGAVSNVALRNDGTAFTWGIAMKGNLGRKTPPEIEAPNVEETDEEIDARKDKNNQTIIKPFQLTPHPVEWNLNLKHFVRSVACGGHHLIAVADADYGSCVFVSGLNNYGQLGLGDLEEKYEMTRVKFLDGKHISQCDGGTHHTIVRSRTEVYTFGRSCSGQLGVTDDVPNAGSFLSTPQLVSFPVGKEEDVDFDSVSAGDYHSFALMKDGRCFAWGYGDMNQLGLGKDQTETRPKLLSVSNGYTVMKVCGGGQHSAAIFSKKSEN